LRYLRGRISGRLLGRGLRLEQIRSEEHHAAHQEEGQQQPHLHGQLFGFLGSRIPVVYRIGHSEFPSTHVTGQDRNRRCEADGIWPNGANPSILPYRRHTVRSLHACIPSTSGGSGTRRAARGRHTICIRAGGALRSIASEKELLHLALQLRQGRIESFATWIDDYGPLGVQPIESETHGFADPPFDAVTHHCLPDRSGDSEADLWSVIMRLSDAKSGKQRTRILRAAIVNSSEIFGSQQANTFRKSRDGVLSLGTYSEFLAAARAAAGQHGSPVFGLHTASESMRLRAMTIIRLKGTFRHCGSSI